MPLNVNQLPLNGTLTRQRSRCRFSMVEERDIVSGLTVTQPEIRTTPSSS